MTTTVTSRLIGPLTSANITTALGYTPYNATNPNSYITGITSANVVTALGFTPYNSTNPNNYVTSDALDAFATHTFVTTQGYVTATVLTQTHTGAVTTTANVTSGNIIASGFYYANGTPFIGGGGSSYSNVDLAAYLAGNITTGNVKANGFYWANGTAFVSGSVNNYSNANVKSYLQTFDGDVLPSANITYSLGSEAKQWKDLWVSSSTIYIGGQALKANAQGISVNNQLVGARYTKSTTAPANPMAGDQWYDTEYDVLYEYIQDVTHSTWVDITGPAGILGLQGIQGEQGNPGTDGSDGTSVIIIGSSSDFASLPNWGNLVAGDGFILQDTGNLAVYDGSAFHDVGTVRGPKGDTGATGPKGDKGDTGATGADGNNGSNYFRIYDSIGHTANINLTTEQLTLEYLNGISLVIDENAKILEISIDQDAFITANCVTSRFVEPSITVSSTSQFTPNWYAGTIQHYSATQNFTLAPPTGMPEGASMTLIITQDGSGNRGMTANAYYKFASGIKTLSTAAGAVDMINFINAGSNTYLAVLTKGYV